MKDIIRSKFCKNDARKIFFRRSALSNKGDFGTVGLLGGCLAYSGALKLAGIAALRSGCGIARLIADTETARTVAPYLLENTLYPYASDTELKKGLEGLKVLGVGMGWGKDKNRQKALEYVAMATNIPIILDADGLNLLADNKDLMRYFKARAVFTPHIGEFSRLSCYTKEEILKDPAATAEAYAKENGVVVLLKGSTTVVTDGDITYLVDKGCPGMATAGSGDVLTGLLTGFVGYSKESLLYTAATAAYVNGEAGERAATKKGEIGMLAHDTAEEIASVIKDLTD